MTDHEYECECGHWECMHCYASEDCHGCNHCSCGKSQEDVISDSGSRYVAKPEWYDTKSSLEK